MLYGPIMSLKNMTRVPFFGKQQDDNQTFNPCSLLYVSLFEKMRLKSWFEILEGKVIVARESYDAVSNPSRP